MAFGGRKSGGWLERLAVAAMAAVALPGLVCVAGGSATAGVESLPRRVSSPGYACTAP